jgi:hypothetical protein
MVFMNGAPRQRAVGARDEVVHSEEGGLAAE